MALLTTITLAGVALTAQTPTTAAPAGDFTYNPEGRRDPFVSLLTRGTERRTNHGQAVEGVSGIATDEISVRGVVASPRGLVAMVQAPDGKTYLVRQNDKLLDGTVKAITPQAVVILQDVNDPLSLVKQREVKKLLHGLEEGK
jgi:type IV pilus assembly protein PilP